LHGTPVYQALGGSQQQIQTMPKTTKQELLQPGLGRPYNASALTKGAGLMEVVPEEKEKGKNLRNSVNSL